MTSVSLSHLSKGPISKRCRIGLGLRWVDSGGGSVHNTCPFPRHLSLEPSVPQAPRLPPLASPGVGNSRGESWARSMSSPLGATPAGQPSQATQPPEVVAGRRCVPPPWAAHWPRKAQPLGGPGTEGTTAGTRPRHVRGQERGAVGVFAFPEAGRKFASVVLGTGLVPSSHLALPCGCRGRRGPRPSQPQLAPVLTDTEPTRSVPQGTERLWGQSSDLAHCSPATGPWTWPALPEPAYPHRKSRMFHHKPTASGPQQQGPGSPQPSGKPSALPMSPRLPIHRARGLDSTPSSSLHGAPQPLASVHP